VSIPASSRFFLVCLNVGGVSGYPHWRTGRLGAGAFGGAGGGRGFV